MSNRVLAFVVLLPIAVVIGFAAGRATAPLGTVTEAWSPDGALRLSVERGFSTGPRKQVVQLQAGDERVDVRPLAPEEEPGDVLWSPDGTLAGIILNGEKLLVIEAQKRRVIYELPLLELRDGSRLARGVGFSANAMAITFDDCPRRGAGCRPRFMALPTRP